MTEEEYQDFINRGGKINKISSKKKKPIFTDHNNREHVWFNHLANRSIN